MQVIAIALVELVRLDRQHDIEIALTAAGSPRIALTLIANAGSIFHSSGHADADGVSPVRQPRAVALETGVGDHLSGAVTNWAGASDGKETLLVTYLPAAGALFASFRTPPGGRAATPAISADLGAANLDLYLLAE